MAKNKSNAGKPSSYVTELDAAKGEQLKAFLVQHDFELSQPPHTAVAGKRQGLSVTLYKSGKLVVQGKNMGEFIQFYLEPEILKSFSYGYEETLAETELDQTPRIGIDESGKGDFFGPLCVAGLYAGGDLVPELRKLGVRDSKAMNDTTIRRVAKELHKRYAHHIVRINPQKYNDLYPKFDNLNKLLAWGHATTIEHVVNKSNCRKVIVDQFASEWVVESALKRKGMDVDLTQRTKAEEDLVVAAASILARDAYLAGLERLEKQFGMTFPKGGASPKLVDAGRAFISRYGEERLPEVAKMHFKTLDRITG